MNSRFRGTLLGQLGTLILAALIIVFSLGLLTPWAIVLWYKWVVKNTTLDGKDLYFDGTAVQLFGSWIKWWLLTIITCGIYGFWVNIKLLEWKVKHTHLIENR